MADNNNKQPTTTQIRNMYSDGMSYLNIKFYNTALAFSFSKFLSKDNLGRSNYDLKHSVNTTVNIEGAAALYKISKDIIDGKITDCDLSIPCNAGAVLMLTCKRNPTGYCDTIFSISKNGETIQHKFTVSQCMINNAVSHIHAGLISFNKTLNGYLEGINADRHLDKLTDDYVKSLSTNGSQPQQNNGYKNNNYRNNNYQQTGYQKKPYNGYQKKQYNGYQNNQNNNWQPQPQQPAQQDFTSYQLPN